MAGGIVVPEDGLPFLVVDAGGEVRTVKCLDQTCTDYEYGASFVSRRGISFLFGPPSLTIGKDGLPCFIFEDLDSEEGDTARFEEGLPPDQPMHLIRCLDPGCSAFTDVVLADGSAHSLAIRNDNVPLISYSPFGETRDDLRDWWREIVIGCGDPDCSDRVDTWIGHLQNAWTHALVGADGLPAIAYGLFSGEEIGLVFCDDPSCVNHERIPVATGTTDAELIGATVSRVGPMLAYRDGPQIFVLSCLDGRCSETGTPVPVGSEMAYGPIRVAWRSDNTPVFAFTEQDGSQLRLATCSDVSCDDVSLVQVTDDATEFDLTVDVEGNPAFLVDGIVIRCIDPACRLGAEPSTLWDRSAQPEALAFPVMEGWELAGVSGVRGGGWFDLIVEGGPGLIAFGQDCGLDRTGVPSCEAQVWVSADGESWQKTASLGDAEFVNVVTSGGTTLVGGTRAFSDEGAAGTQPAATTRTVTVAPALWLSTDGLNWSLVSTDPALFSGCTDADPMSCTGVVGDIVPVDDGFWAMGWNASGPTAWKSIDGLVWESGGYPLDAVDSEDVRGEAFMNWAVIGGDGIVASGYDCTSGGAGLICDLLAMTSADGITWRLLPPAFESEGDLDFFKPESWKDGYVSLAQVCDLDGECVFSMATSPDAVSWHVDSIEDVWPPVFVETLHEFDDGLIAFGGYPNLQTNIAVPVFIHSDDFATWTVEAADPDLFPPDKHAIADTIWFGDRLIAVGMTTGGPTVWTHDG